MYANSLGHVSRQNIWDKNESCACVLINFLCSLKVVCFLKIPLFHIWFICFRNDSRYVFFEQIINCRNCFKYSISLNVALFFSLFEPRYDKIRHPVFQLPLSLFNWNFVINHFQFEQSYIISVKTQEKNDVFKSVEKENVRCDRYVDKEVALAFCVSRPAVTLCLPTAVYP